MKDELTCLAVNYVCSAERWGKGGGVCEGRERKDAALLLSYQQRFEFGDLLNC